MAKEGHWPRRLGAAVQRGAAHDADLQALWAPVRVPWCVRMTIGACSHSSCELLHASERNSHCFVHADSIKLPAALRSLHASQQARLFIPQEYSG